MRLSFHGGVGTVTGSRHLLDAGDAQLLVDAGMFQGLKKLRALNWKKPSFDPTKVDHLFLTHTHIDHAGYLPRLVRDGFRGTVFSTPATRDLAKLLLMDSAKIQEEDARFANKKGFSKHKPALPLYDSDDVEKALGLFESVDYGECVKVGKHCQACFAQIGHILGSAMIEVTIDRGDRGVFRIVFSGDIGRYDMPLHLDPQPLPGCDALVVESTYGDRTHDHQPLEEQIVEPFTRTIERGGVIVIPSFAVGRSQQVTLILREMMKAGSLPEVPIHIDSPMAIDATSIYSRYLNETNLDECLSSDGRSRLFPREVYFSRSVEQSKELNRMRGPRIIISASGMMTAGRILHHLKQRLPDPKNLLCVVGYQAAGTRGRRVLNGATELRIHGEDVPVRAHFMTMNGLSGHADRNEILHWIGTAPQAPKHVFVTHGEAKSADAMAEAIGERFGAKTYVPQMEDGYDIDAL